MSHAWGLCTHACNQSGTRARFSFPSTVTASCSHLQAVKMPVLSPSSARRRDGVLAVEREVVVAACDGGAYSQTEGFPMVCYRRRGGAAAAPFSRACFTIASRPTPAYLSKTARSPEIQRDCAKPRSPPAYPQPAQHVRGSAHKHRKVSLLATCSRADPESACSA